MALNLTRRSVGAFAAGLAASAANVAGAAEPNADGRMPPKGPWTHEGVVQRAGGQIHYVGLGNGPPLVLLHKAGGWVADWRHIAPLLATVYWVVAIDMPGHGDSTFLGPPPFLQTLPESAALIAATLDELGIGSFDLVGNSLGGCCSVVLAAHWPERVKHLGLIGVALTKARPRPALDADESMRGPVQSTSSSRSFEDAKMRFGLTDIAVYEEQNASGAKVGAWLPVSSRGVGAAGVVDYLPRVQAPTLLVYGERGGYKQYEAPGKAGLKNVRSVHIQDAGSFAHQDNPKETAKVLLEFLAT